MTTPTNREGVAEKIKIICSHKGCPRTTMADKQDTDPIKAVVMEIDCPWHEKSGEFDSPIYYDKDGNQVGIEPDDYAEVIGNIYQNPDLLKE